MNDNAQALNPVVTLSWWQVVALVATIAGGAIYLGEVAIGAVQDNVTGLRDDINERFAETGADDREIRGSLSQSVDKLTDQISKLRDDLHTQVTTLGDRIVSSNDQLRKDLVEAVTFRYNAIDKRLDSLDLKLDDLSNKIQFQKGEFRPFDDFKEGNPLNNPMVNDEESMGERIPVRVPPAQ